MFIDHPGEDEISGELDPAPTQEQDRGGGGPAWL